MNPRRLLARSPAKGVPVPRVPPGLFWSMHVASKHLSSALGQQLALEQIEQRLVDRNHRAPTTLPLPSLPCSCWVIKSPVWTIEMSSSIDAQFFRRLTCNLATGKINRSHRHTANEGDRNLPSRSARSSRSLGLLRFEQHLVTPHLDLSSSQEEMKLLLAGGLALASGLLQLVRTASNWS